MRDWSLGYFKLGLFIVLLLLWLLLLLFEFVFVFCCWRNFICDCLVRMFWLFLLLLGLLLVWLEVLIRVSIWLLVLSCLFVDRLFMGVDGLYWCDLLCEVCVFVMLFIIYLGLDRLWDFRGRRFWFDGENVWILCFWNVL